ncbi:ROK family protein (plasmid) [Deinococcus metallilatus]|uniref:NBD/HSP70 family sugar kinase n=1 Tax=Deinococcus metallilatus TaxID=1211322 RepID=A0AAJ5FCB9_9DEIO|nr:ROK family protein [Deinococcus metallilatus]MBB5293517.1 putative NBD/HSP70 family sugar kinase [Deinococcus metallilatus]QBY06594.1 ROK family protein [Deinococcus metallilatus]RXJ17937.1 ROK family protein [Deinococcus metallilatus]TLK32208.1 ROK family protein [Deinococcus metallilatus]GMA15263.1 N-acetylmannosamine kinase [Deinococcus metallilatus]
MIDPASAVKGGWAGAGLSGGPVVLDVGATTTRVTIPREDGLQPPRYSRTPALQGPEAVTRHLATEILSLNPRPSRVGVAIFGFVEDGHVTALDTSIAPGWQQFPLQCRLEEALRCPVQVVNDAHAAALGEYQALGVTENFLYVTVSTGIGGGLVLPSRTGGAAYSGPAELGYVPVLTPQGQQLVEYLSSGSALSRLAGEQGYRDVQQLYRAAEAGDAQAEGLIRAALAPLAEKVLGLTAPLSIRRVALGGGVGFRPLSLKILTQHLQASLCPVKPILQHAVLGDSAGLAGMASLTPLLSGEA